MSRALVQKCGLPAKHFRDSSRDLVSQVRAYNHINNLLHQTGYRGDDI